MTLKHYWPILNVEVEDWPTKRWTLQVENLNSPVSDACNYLPRVSAYRNCEHISRTADQFLNKQCSQVTTCRSI
jgi:hypothetical protein